MERRQTESSGLPILVIEDEEAILRGLCDVLAFQGYAPEGVARGDLGLARVLESERDPALVVLDVMLPGLNGFEVCEQLRRARPALPILMLTARGSEEDILRGFRSGADDYVTKPFSVSELVARVAALLRRARPTDAEASTHRDDSGTSDNSGIHIDEGIDNRAAADSTRPREERPREPFSFGSWSVEPDQRLARTSSASIELTPRDLELLAFFAREPGRILSRRRMLAEVWGYPDPERVETRSVDMHIAKLRKKLGARDGALIETIRGEGYRFRG